MVRDFFEEKRDWSAYKDLILEYYLDPYIAKVAHLRKPILIVDCCAGRGKFADGKPGSPLIIAEAIKKWRSKDVNVNGLYIEDDAGNYGALRQNLAIADPEANIQLGKFEDFVQLLAQRASSETTFMYIDPYTVKGLIFEKMKMVFAQIHLSGASVEVLMNFNVGTFMRWALAALKRIEDLPDAESELNFDYMADDPNESVEISTLNNIAGGDYWLRIAEDKSISFEQKLAEFASQYRKKLSSVFQFVCTYDVKSKYEHKVPKYLLVYGTRHPDGMELMSDGMCKAKKEFLGRQFNNVGQLFNMIPEKEDIDTDELRSWLRTIMAESPSLTRKALRLKALPQCFCRFTSSDVNRAIAELLKSGKLFSSTGKTRISDEVKISSAPF